jgi:hypothetical protein
MWELGLAAHRRRAAKAMPAAMLFPFQGGLVPTAQWKGWATKYVPSQSPVAMPRFQPGSMPLGSAADSARGAASPA